MCSLARDVVEHDDGFEFRFRDESGPDLLNRVSAWVVNERRCCPFFTFDLSMPPPAVGPVTLRLRGSPEAKEVMRSELLARSVVARLAGPEEVSSIASGPQAIGSAGLVAGAGALLCVVGCAAPMLAVGGAMASSLALVAGYAEKVGMMLTVGGLVGAVVLLVVRARRPRHARPAGAGCPSGSCGRTCG